MFNILDSILSVTMSKKKYSCVFNSNWLSDSCYSPWLTKASSKWRAYCSFCCKDFDISNMGVSVFASHAAGKKHSDIGASRASFSSQFLKAKRLEANNDANQQAPLEWKYYGSLKLS